MTDISTFMNDFLNLLLSLFSQCFNFLSSIQFFGMSLLSYVIALFVMSIAIPILFSLVRGNVRSFKSMSRKDFRRSDDD